MYCFGVLRRSGVRVLPVGTNLGSDGALPSTTDVIWDDSHGA